MERLLTADRLAQDLDGVILEDVTIKGASTSLTALSLTPHALTPGLLSEHVGDRVLVEASLAHEGRARVAQAVDGEPVASPRSGR
jgi:hypothetical protein